jgi:phospholipase C
LARGDYHAAAIIYQIQQSFIWDDAVIIITYAENGIWDQMAPPKIDRWGPARGCPRSSSRRSPRCISSTMQNMTSILNLIETRRGITPLGDRDAHAADWTNALQLK